MKKSILIVVAVLTTFSLTAFGFKFWGEEPDHKEQKCSQSNYSKRNTSKSEKKRTKTDFIYDVDHRFNTTITKENLHKARSIVDLVPMNSTQGIESFEGLKVAVITEGGEKFEMSDSSVLNSSQLSLLQATDYSTNFYIEANCMRKNSVSREVKKERFVYYITIVPEKEAEFKDGQTALLDYFKKNSKKEVAKVKMDQLKPGKVFFTITKNGKITNAKLESTSGYSSLDKKMIELITNMPGEWMSATNSKGEKIDQKLVFSYGLMGC